MSVKFLGLMVPLFLLSSEAIAAKEDIFALIVTNNRGLANNRPDLHYADDDGARYYRVFRLVAQEDHITLLMTFDNNSSRLYPDLSSIVKPARFSDIQKSIQELAGRIEASKKQGNHTVFYFIFAGHGDVDRGKGYLELEDGRLGPNDLENQVINPIKANVIHLVLDSCNSFFVVNPRKPGGRRWATPKDMTEGFSKRYPHVGVFLSTSAEGEVYEWSEIQSGIFSHEVRSGLSGAADINGDGKTSYAELESFVAVANNKIKNEYYRPNLFSRGPWNKRSATLFTYRYGSGRHLTIGQEERRLWIRDKEGNRLLDLNKERGFKLHLVIPVANNESIYVQEELNDPEFKSRSVVRQYVISEREDIIPLTLLSSEPTPIRSRGHSAVFKQIFSEPYGPRAYAKQIAEFSNQPDMFFGISRNDEARMRHYLSSLSRDDKKDRIFIGGLSLGGGATIIATGALAFNLLNEEPELILPGQPPTERFDGKTIGKIGAIGLMTIGSMVAAWGIYQLFRTSEGEKAHATFEREIRLRDSNRERVVAITERHLYELAQRDKWRRRYLSLSAYLIGGICAASTISIGILDAMNKIGDLPTSLYFLGGFSSVFSIGLGVSLNIIDMPSERVLRLYREDPDLHPRFYPTALKGGFALSFSSSF